MTQNELQLHAAKEEFHQCNAEQKKSDAADFKNQAKISHGGYEEGA